MSEAEFNRLLEAVQTAIAPAPQEDFLTNPTFNPPRAANDNAHDSDNSQANDNQMAWGFIPFPEGWHAAC